MTHTYPVSWFEIPATDFDRAVKFYSRVFDREFPVNITENAKMAFFTDKPMEVSGVIIEEDGAEPSPKGVLIYLNGGDNLNVPLSRVEVAGGTIVQPKTLISVQLGYYAIFIDSEGNRLGLHSMG
ncbi:MAG TPA: VOC family protein [Flammeovirgaceae bacterium]|nr:VOC family protein [Flammeovirgaceae bacterium]